MSFDSQHGARPMGGGRKEGRDGRSFGTPGTHGVSRALYGIWPRFLLRVLIYGDSGKAAASRGGKRERERKTEVEGKRMMKKEESEGREEPSDGGRHNAFVEGYGRVVDARKGEGRREETWPRTREIVRSAILFRAGRKHGIGKARRKKL